MTAEAFRTSHLHADELFVEVEGERSAVDVTGMSPDIRDLLTEVS